MSTSWPAWGSHHGCALDDGVLSHIHLWTRVLHVDSVVVGGIGRHGQAEGSGTDDEQLGVSRHRHPSLTFNELNPGHP
jgi:hypothetical protein